MLNTTLPPMRPELVVCPNSVCGASGRIGVHSLKEHRYKCHACGKNFAETSGTLLFGLKHPLWLVGVVLALLATGCPVPAVVFAFGLDEPTVADWQAKAGRHAKTVQEQLVGQGAVDLGQVQADELYAKTQAGPVWIATAMTVLSRLWLWGAVGWERDATLVEPVIERVRGRHARASDPVRGRWLQSVGDHHSESVSRPVAYRQARTSAAAGVGGSAHRASREAAGWAAAGQYHTAAGAWKYGLCRSNYAGDTSRAWLHQHRVYRAAECDLAHLAAGLGAAHADASGPARAIGSGVVLDGLRVQLLSGACDLGGYARNGGRSDRSCVVN